MNLLFYFILWPTFGSYSLLKLIFTFLIGILPIYLKLKTNDFKLNKIFVLLSFLILISTFFSYSISIILGNGPNGFNLNNYLLDISRFILITFIPMILFDVIKKSKPPINHNIDSYTNYQIQGILFILSLQLLQLISIIFRVPYSEVIIFNRFTGPFSYLDEASLFTFLVFIGIAFNSSIDKRNNKLILILLLFIPISILSASKAALILFFTAVILFLFIFIINIKISSLSLNKFKFKVNIKSFIQVIFLSILLIIGLPKLSLTLSWISSGFSALIVFLSELINLNLNYSLTPKVVSNMQSFSSRINEMDLCFNSFSDYLIPYLPFGSITFSGLPSRVSISIFDLICTYGSIPTLLIVINLSIILSFYLFERLTLKFFILSFIFTIFLGCFTSFIKGFKIILILSFMAGNKLILKNKNYRL